MKKHKKKPVRVYINIEAKNRSTNKRRKKEKKAFSKPFVWEGSKQGGKKLTVLFTAAKVKVGVFIKLLRDSVERLMRQHKKKEPKGEKVAL